MYKSLFSIHSYMQPNILYTYVVPELFQRACSLTVYACGVVIVLYLSSPVFLSVQICSVCMNINVVIFLQSHNPTGAKTPIYNPSLRPQHSPVD